MKKRKRNKFNNEIVFEDEYYVEKIADKRINEDDTVQYLIKWKNFDEDQNSWELDKDIFCRDLITEFEIRNRVVDVVNQENEKIGTIVLEINSSTRQNKMPKRKQIPQMKSVTEEKKI